VKISLHAGDCRDVLVTLADNSIDAVLCDPPYDLTLESGGGFMGKAWDATGIAFDPEMWMEVLRVLKPGGVVKAFGGTRTFHRMVVAMRTAGFEKVAMSLKAWGYGSGFPKSLNVGKSIDRSGGSAQMHLKMRRKLARDIRRKRLDAGLSRRQLAALFPHHKFVTENWEREDKGFRIPSLEDYEKLVSLLGVDPRWRGQVRAQDSRIKEENVRKDRRGDQTVYGLAHSGVKYTASTDLAKRWEGYGTALKPAWEPIVCGRKPG